MARNRSDFWLVLADEQGRSFRIDLPTSPVVVEADVSEVAAVIDALVGNVFAHTPPGIGFDLVVRAENGMAVLSVDDAGPGFPDRAVVRRGESRAGSTGLGLDIASRFAERSGGSLVAGKFAARRGQGRGATSQPVAFTVSQRDRIASISSGVKR